MDIDEVVDLKGKELKRKKKIKITRKRKSTVKRDTALARSKLQESSQERTREEL